ncbi:MAG: glycosyltransferase family 2 protein [Elusimicrobiaceae bacterium]|nr:glycosyltransferase family 2 protein [Elusimicrobiaceae bacterium]
MQTFKLENKLEILIPTYNRKPHITRTLAQLTAPESPVHACPITVLDNASEDGSSEVIADFAKKFPNIKHIRHTKNIGGNANITRAYELACKPYVWVVCDDDSFRWDSWDEIQNALETNDYDMLLTRKNEFKGRCNLARIFRQCTFVPAVIYRTSLISDGVLMNMYNNIPNLFPHLAIASEVLNRKGRIFLPQGEVLAQCTFDEPHSGDEHILCGARESFAPSPTTHMFWTVGFLNSVQLVEDENLRTYLRDHFGKHGFLGYLIGAFRKNYTHYHGYHLNEAFVRNGLNFRQRLEFELARLFLKMTAFTYRKK